MKVLRKTGILNVTFVKWQRMWPRYRLGPPPLPYHLIVIFDGFLKNQMWQLYCIVFLNALLV
jgi:hypothetical protein